MSTVLASLTPLSSTLSISWSTVSVTLIVSRLILPHTFPVTRESMEKVVIIICMFNKVGNATVTVETSGQDTLYMYNIYQEEEMERRKHPIPPVK